MSLPTPSKRQQIHTRSISYTGYRRDDGLWDMEAHMTDKKSYQHKSRGRGEIEIGSPIHEMLIRITIDDSFIVQDIVAITEHSPYDMCADITPNYRSLIGATVGPGWRKAIHDRVGGVKGCTHITELLYPIATVAFQTIMPWRNHNSKQDLMQSSTRKPFVLNTCHAWADTSPVVKKNMPEFYLGE